MRTFSGGVARRISAVAALMALVAAIVVASPGAASASTGGSGQATGVQLDVASVTIDGVPITTVLTATAGEASTPPPPTGTDGETVSASVPPVLDAGAATVEVERTNGALASTAQIAGASVSLLGVTDLVTTGDISSASVCPIPELAAPTSDAQVADLQVAGTPVSVGSVDVPVPVTLSVPDLTGAEALVTVTQTQASDGGSASATALLVSVDLEYQILDLDPVRVNVLELALAQTSCTVPTADAPTAASIDPPAGTELTPVTITGTGFIPGATTVDFGGTTIPAADVTVNDAGTTADFLVPENSPLGPTTVTASTPVGTTGPLDFEVLASPPTATSITPEQGPEGTTATITGSEFVPGETTVDFGGTTIGAGDVAVTPDGTSLTFDVPNGAPLGPTDVTVTTPGGTTDPLGFLVTSADAPTALTISPDQGPEGTTVTITGSDFVPTATSVGFGGITVPPADVAVSPDGTSLTFDVPTGAPLGPTDVTVTTPAGTSGPLGFLVTSADAPTALSLYPEEGPEGVTVTVTGDDFVPTATSVGFGAQTIPATDVSVAPDGTELTFVVPPGSPLGPTDVTVTTPAGTSTPPLVFTVTPIPDPPTATGLTPDLGPVGTTVEMTGTDFVPGGTSVTVDGITVPPTEVSVAPDGESLLFDIPPGVSLGPVDVTATTPGGTTGPLDFLVTAGVAPTALDIDPDQGPEGTTVTITGSDFVPTATSIDFGSINVPATDVDVSPDGTSLTFDVPNGAPLGPTDVTVTTPDGTSGPLGFLVTAGEAPTALDIDPEQGPEGTTVTITGVDFVPTATSVQFGAITVPAADVSVNPAGTELTFEVPTGAPLGPTTVRVATPDGTSGPLGFLVTSADAPTALDLYPDEGPHGVTVTVSGSDFVPTATSIELGAITIPASQVNVSADGDLLTFVVPDTAPIGPTTVTVVTPAGDSNPLAFTVTELPDPPTASGLDPDEGPEGTTVTMTGTDFVPGGTSIEFGDVTIPATEVVVADGGESLTFEVPDGAPLGVTDVVATTPAGSTDPLEFLVTANEPPTATGIDPDAGPIGTVVTVDGTNFVPGDTVVHFGDITIPADDVAVAGDGTSLTFEVPPGAPLGDTDVTVETPNGESGSVSFEVLPPPPSIDDIDPGSGPGGTTIVIHGDDFRPGETGVWFGDLYIPPSDVDVSGDGTTLTFVVPPEAPLGETVVFVDTPGGDSNSVLFTVTADDGGNGGGTGGNGTGNGTTGSRGSGGSGAATPTSARGSLPYTGSDGPLMLAVIGLVLLAGGAAAVLGGTWALRSGSTLVRRRPDKGRKLF